MGAASGARDGMQVPASVSAAAGAGSGSPRGASSEAAGSQLPDDDWIVEMHFEELDSTQSFVERSHEDFDQTRLTVVSADFQTSGRGTRERQWEAIRGQSVLMTFFFRFPPGCSTHFVNSNAPNVTKVLSLATVDALAWALSAANLPDGGAGIKFGVKWPNDVVVNGHKIAGVLARAILCRENHRLDGVVIGVGVNINQTREELDLIKRPVWPATSLFAITGAEQAFDVAAIRRHLVRRFASELRVFFSSGFPVFRDRINQLEVLMGTEVRFRVSDHEEIDGTFEGVDLDGLIVIRMPSGATRSFPAGELIPRQ